MTSRWIGSILLLLALVVEARAAPAERPLLRWPALSGDSVIFVHADELWIAPVAGGRATQLATPRGKKFNARVSPDGALVAFTSYAGGNMDVYVMPARGGEARRLTYHPALDTAVGWTPDGRSVLFSSRRASFTHPVERLFTVPREGGAAQALAMTLGGPAAFSPDGKRIALNRNSPESWYPWRGYRGGRRAALSLHDLASHQEIAIAPANANDVFPMWDGGAIYFASDRDGRMNLYRYDVATRALAQLTHHRDADVRHPSLGRGRIAYELLGELRVLDLASGRDDALRIAIDGARPEQAARQVAIAPWVSSFDAAPDGARALVSGRGELFEATSDGRSIVDLTQTSGVREHGGVYAPDGKRIAYVSDASGEYEIYLRATGAPDRRLTRLGAGFRRGLRWSPDGRKLVFADQSQSIHVLDVAAGSVVRVDGSRNAAIEVYDWTPDSSSVIYASTEDNQLDRLYRYDLATRRREALGDGMTHDSSPAVAGSGARKIYFLSARNWRTSFSDFEQTFNFNDTIGIYAMPTDRVDPAGPASVERLPVDAGSLSRLSWSDGRLFYLARDRKKGSRALHAFDLARTQDTTLADDVTDYRAIRGAVVVQTGGRLQWISLGAAPPSPPSIDLGALTMKLDPVQEWRQIFVDAWRLERDYFYQAAMNGVDWRAVRARYEPLVAGVGSRGDLNYLLDLMTRELATSHAGSFGGDAPDDPAPRVGVLGGELVADRGRYRVARVLRGDASAPETRSPLAVAGVKAGELIVAIDGRALTTAEDIHARLVDTVGKELTLTVAAGSGATRAVKVTPAADEMAIRYADWVADNRARVARATGGRCGYIHVPDTHRGGIAAFARQFFAQIDREALIVDIRYNRGGLFAASMIEHLRRIPLAVYAQRHGNDVRVPGAAVHGPKVLLTNSYTVSGGDGFASYFRAAGLGRIVGGRTQGATIGNVGMPALVDDGEIGVPALAYVPRPGAPATENAGVVPDVEIEPALVEPSPEPDPQLAAAIAEIARQLPPRP